MAGPEVSLRGCLWRQQQQLKDSRSLDFYLPAFIYYWHWHWGSVGRFLRN